MKTLFRIGVLLALFIAGCTSPVTLQQAVSESETTRNVIPGQNGTLYQYFHWYTAGGATLWNTIKNDVTNLDTKGVTAVWMPPAYKGNGGVDDVGYGVYDMYDLGEFNQKGTVATRYGTKQQYLDAISALHGKDIQVYGDIVMNHKIGADATETTTADKINWDNRNAVLASNVGVTAWTAFNYSVRNNAYSSFKWNKSHFDAVDWNQATSEKAIFRFAGKSWDWQVDTEKGNYDYLMGADVDFDNTEVDIEYKNWAKWYMNTASLDGLRIDAVKHIKFSWFNGWLDYLRGTSGVNKNFFAVGEYVSGDVGVLNNFITVTGGRMSLFDFPLHYRLQTASNSAGGYDMRTIFDYTLTKDSPTLSVPFVDNHDTQPLQALASPVADWFKPIAYSLILTRQNGYPMVFWLDEFGATYTDKGQTVTIPATPKLAKIMEVRRNYAYGVQTDYFDSPDIIGWTRQGSTAMPGSGLAALVSDAAGGSKSMYVGTAFSGRVFYDYTGNTVGTVTISSTGYGTFSVNGGSIALWVPQQSATPPATPTGLSATAISYNRVNLAWTAASGATSYTVFRSTVSGGTFNSVGTSTTNTYADTETAGSTTYYYKVSASNSGGSSAQTSQVSATTPAAPAGLKIHFKKNTVANWTVFNAYYWASNGSPISNSWPGSAMTAEANSWYGFTIPAATSSNIIVNNGTTQTVDLNRATGEGWFIPTGTASGKITGTWYDSNPDVLTAPLAPTNLGASAVSTTQINLSWTASANAGSYTVYRSTASAGTYASVGTSATNSFNNTGLTSNTTYYYKVTATNTAGTSGYSNIASDKTQSTTVVTTTIRVTYDVGMGNSMYIRGSLSPLSWTVGTATTWSAGNVWTYTTTSIPSGAAFEIKALINDTRWSDGANFAGVGGTTINITPLFNGNFYDTMDTISTNWGISGGTTTNKWYQGPGAAQANATSSISYLTQKFSMSKTGSAVTLAFKYKVTNLDAGEYLKVQVLKGSTWTNVATYSGTVDWTNTSVDITAYQSTAMKLRFLSFMNGADEWVYVDNVTVSVRL